MGYCRQRLRLDSLPLGARWYGVRGYPRATEPEGQAYYSGRGGVHYKEHGDKPKDTGPVGYIGKNNAEFAVAIRSGLIHGNQLSLYAGAGIVDGSTAEGEWNEIENKISNFMKVFQKET